MNQDQQRRRTRIGLVATDPLRLLGLEAILASGAEAGANAGTNAGSDEQPHAGFEIVSLADPGAVASHSLELVLIDSVATAHLFELLAEFRQGRPRLHLIVLGSQTDLDHIERVIGAGARGYLRHTATESELKMAIEVVLDGSVWAPRKVLSRLLDRGQKERDESASAALAAETPAMPELTRRESEVLKLLMEGHPNRDIALALGVDEGTVKAHLGRLMRKLGVGNRTALTMQVVERKTGR